MTNDEIKAAIERLKSMPCDDTQSVYIVTGTFMDMDMNGSYSAIGLRNRLIGLLEQADPETHMELPRDADGVPIHVGDRVDGIEGKGEIGIVTSVLSDGIVLDNHAYAYNPKAFKHYKLTVEDVLREFGDEVRTCCDTEDTIAEYAAKLREVMQDE